MMQSGQIVVSNHLVLSNLLLQLYSPVLVTIVSEIAKDHGVSIKKGFEFPKNMFDHHGKRPCDAIDLDWIYPDKIGYEIVQEINNNWEYSPGSSNIVAEVRNRGIQTEIHIQVCNETQRRRFYG